jgi:cbb3-type cytochrome oxidase subunit 3
MGKFFKKCWMWISGVAILLLGVIFYVFTRKKKEPKKPEPVLEMHNEAVDIIIEISEKEYDEIEEALKSDDPAADIAARINSGGGPL